MRRPTMMLLCAATVAAAAQTMQPGLWETTTEVKSMAMPNMPPGFKHPLAGRTTSMRHCVRAEDIAKAPESVFQATDGKCRYTQFRMSGGTIDATMQCQGGMTGRSKGTFTATSYAMSNDVAMTNGMKMSSKITGRRVGDCK